MITIDLSQNITIENITVENSYHPLFWIDQSEVISISSVQISNNQEPFKITSSKVTLLSHSNFKMNGLISKVAGGAFNLFNSEIEIFNSSFTENIAKTGGAISFLCNSMLKWNLKVTNSSFIKNTAEVKGGAIYYDFNYPTIEATIFESNAAQYGSNIGSYPVRIGLISDSLYNNVIINDIGSGLTIKETLTLALLDYNDQVMNLDSSSQISIFTQDSNIATIGGINVVKVNKGVAIFNSISAISHNWDSSGKFSISSKIIDTKKVISVFGTNLKQPDLILSFRDWNPGEKIDGSKWRVCAAGTYSVFSNSTECTKCLSNAKWFGDQQISVNKGYWRMYQNSTFISQCLNKNACLGGYNNEILHPINCEKGYTGSLWTKCMIKNGIKYQQMDGYECRKWPNPVLNAIQVVLGGLLVFAFFMLLIIINVRKTEESELSVLFRILTNYLQLTTVSMSINSSYPGVLNGILIPFQRFGGSSEVFLSFDCFIRDSEIKGPFDSNEIFKLFLLLLLPLLIFLAVSMIWVIVYLIKPQWIKNLVRNLVISFISILFLLHPKLAEKSIGVFNCVEIDKGVKVTQIDTDIECYSTTHLKWCLLIALPILIIWVTASPLIALVLMFKYKGIRNEKEKKIFEYFLILQQGLKPDKFYWEFVNTLRKILILFSLLFHKSVIVTVSLLILLGSGRLGLYLKPYKKSANSKLEFLAIMASVSTIISGVIFSEKNQIDFLNVIILAIMIIINLKFMLEWLYLLLKIYEK